MTEEGKYFDPSREIEYEPELTFRFEVEIGRHAKTLADVARIFANAVNTFSGNCDELDEGDGAQVLTIKGENIGHWTVQEKHS